MSNEIEEILIRTDNPVISWLTEVELASAFAKKFRMNQLNEIAVHSLIDTFQAQVNEGYYKRIALDMEHFVQAAQWVKSLKTGLRTLDALHLAVAALENIP